VRRRAPRRDRRPLRRAPLSWGYRLKARYQAEGEAALEPQSPSTPDLTQGDPTANVDLVLRLRKLMLEAGHDAGADALAWHLAQHHQVTLGHHPPHPDPPRRGHPGPKKRPRSSYIRFQAAMLNVVSLMRA